VNSSHLGEQWGTRDRPVLMRFAQHFAEDATSLQTKDPECLLAITALMPTYLDARITRSAGGTPYVAVSEASRFKADARSGSGRTKESRPTP
jgi:hypothetical protein